MRTVEEMLDYARKELTTLRQQGCDTWELEREEGLIRKHGGAEALVRARKLRERLGTVRAEPDWPYDEPDSLEAIRAQRPQGPRRIAIRAAGDAVRDRTLAAWLGRAAGCMLGKPVDGWTRARILDTLQYWGEIPVVDYLPPAPEGLGAGWPHPHDSPLLRGNIACAAGDPALDATLLALHVAEEYGPSFRPVDAADQLLRLVPYGRTRGATRAAYRNLVAGIAPPCSGRSENPERESMDAMVGSDLWGLLCPGRPQEAAEMAFRDACVTHARNGVYAAMWLAAVGAAALLGPEPRQALEIGLSEVPARCRLADAVRQVLQWRDGECPAEDAVCRIADLWKGYDSRHAIPNAAAVAVGILYGERDFTRTIGTALVAGRAAAANCSAAGAICGALAGCRGIDDRWREPLGNRLQNSLLGGTCVSISDLAERTARMQERFCAADGTE